MLKGKTVLLGVSSSIAAYKMCNVARVLTKLGADVHVSMTANAQNFVHPLSQEKYMNVYNITSENFDILTKSDKIILEKLLKRCLVYRNFNNTETLYHFSCKSINSYIPNVKH